MYKVMQLKASWCFLGLLALLFKITQLGFEKQGYFWYILHIFYPHIVFASLYFTITHKMSYSRVSTLKDPLCESQSLPECHFFVLEALVNICLKPDELKAYTPQYPGYLAPI